MLSVSLISIDETGDHFWVSQSWISCICTVSQATLVDQFQDPVINGRQAIKHSHFIELNITCRYLSLELKVDIHYLRTSGSRCRRRDERDEFLKSTDVLLI